MHNTFFATGALMLCLSGLAAGTSAKAEGYGHAGTEYGHGPRPSISHRYDGRHAGHYGRRHARVLPPEMPYRDQRVDLRPHGRPDFLIHAYLPRPTMLPLYNEPPQRFPQR